MADEQPTIQAVTAPTTLLAIPSQDHAPAIPSPLNPDSSTARPKPTRPPPREREQREKKDSLKKRESNYARGDSPTIPSKRKASEAIPSAPSPMRYSIPEPKLADYDPPKETPFASHEPLPFVTPDGELELKKPLDLAENKRGYRYSHCVADPYFRHKQYYRQTDTTPYGPRFSFEDTDKWMHFDTSGRYITNEKGWRMARANVCAREGSVYYEVRVVRGVPADGSGLPAAAAGPQPHVRMGWARREAPLDSPVGFDGYSYGVTDMRFETMHRSRPGKFFHPKSKKGAKAKAGAPIRTENTPVELKEDIREGDVIGMEITLPGMALHQKVVNGVYNPAVDIGDGLDDPYVKNQPGAEIHDVIRDRIPVPYKANIYFETMDYVSTKPVEAYTDRTLSLSSLAQAGSLPGANSTIKAPPNPNHVDPALRTLPHSSVKVYKNGALIGTAFENLLAFLPPASLPSKAAGAREGFDDGMLGYFPAIACFSGGIAEVNFGEHGFWSPPPHIRATKQDSSKQAVNGQITESGDNENGWKPGRALRPIAERYAEQVAEDVVWDIIDEVDFFMQDGGFGGKVGAGAGDTKQGVASLKEEAD